MMFVLHFYQVLEIFNKIGFESISRDPYLIEPQVFEWHQMASLIANAFLYQVVVVVEFISSFSQITLKS